MELSSKQRRLVEDLAEVGVLEEANAANLTPPQQAMVLEFEYALHPPLHEGRTPSYGCIICPAQTIEPATTVPISSLEMSVARQMADGQSCFAIRSEIGLESAYCFASSVQDEGELVLLRRTTGGVLLQRDLSGTVRIFGDDVIHIHEHGAWRIKPYADSVVAQICDSAPQADPQVLFKILKFCFHVLSTRHIGATLVWILDGSEHLGDYLQPGIAVGSASIHLTDENIHGCTASLLAQHDKAAILDRQGKLMSIENMLMFSQNTGRMIASDGGTRHTSAKRFSFDDARTLVFVVSEDGPVSVFSDGMKLTELSVRPIGSAMEAITKYVPEKRDQTWQHVNETVCPRCGKTIVAEIVVVAGWRDTESEDCPVCGERDIVSAKCHRIHTRVKKT